ncbi:hypothetical protein LXL04_033192 [Taraxacum kok-saghyz]
MVKFAVNKEELERLVSGGIIIKGGNTVQLEVENVDLRTHTYWEQKLPSDCEDIINFSKEDSLQWTTKKELYSIFCKWFPIQSIPLKMYTTIYLVLKPRNGFSNHIPSKDHFTLLYSTNYRTKC